MSMVSTDVRLHPLPGIVVSLIALAACGAIVTLIPRSAEAGRFVFGELTYAEGYTGTGGQMPVKVCWKEGSDAERIAPAQRSILNAIARWNRLQPASANVRETAIGQNQVDFESVILHELGHCLGLGHPNLGTLVNGSAVNATAARTGPNGTFDVAPGDDGIHGTADDVRSDDLNVHYFRSSNNNPFTLADTVDALSYSTDPARLPAGDLFPRNAEREVGRALGSPHTEAVMQHDILTGQINRNLAHDDVATLRYAMSGLDERAGGADDYRIELVYSSDPADGCGITLGFDNARTAAASCRVTGVRDAGGQAVFIRTGDILINDQVDWFFNQSPPCTMRRPVPANRWILFSLPCDVGVSTSARVRDVLGDDLGETRIDSGWSLLAYDTARGGDDPLRASYRSLTLDDELEYGRAYWLIDIDGGRSIEVQGEYPVQVDWPLDIAELRGGWHLVGNPFRFASRWPDAQVLDASGRMLSIAEADPPIDSGSGSACSVQPVPDARCTMHSTAYRWNGDTEAYVPLTAESGTIGPFGGAWVHAAKPGVLLRLAMPNKERITP